MRKYLLILFLLISITAFAANTNEIKTEKYFEKIKSNPIDLNEFLTELPKGGDLHNHESGALWAENMISYASKDHLCVDRETYKVTVNPQCKQTDFLEEAVKDSAFYNKLIDAWSMRNFVPKPESGHDHFFAAFDKFGTIASKHHAENIQDISRNASLQNISYLEIMTTIAEDDIMQVAHQIGWDPNFTKMRERMLASNFNQIVNKILTTLEKGETDRRRLLSCDIKQSKLGCEVKIKYLYQVLREEAPEVVFAELLAGFETANQNKNVVGINMVQPEDGLISMRDYKLHMQMIKFLRSQYPNVHVSLHAGELASQLVPPEGLTFHIDDAVNVASADRIGHGVDIAFETRTDKILKTMAQNHILVEINLSSNADILNIKGNSHPLPLYLKYGVPVALSTDDEGVTRDEMTKEYKIAIDDFQLTYSALKNMVRNSIEYAFLSGDSLWQDHNYHKVNHACASDILGTPHPSKICNLFLSANEKAIMQWDLEHRFSQFEGKYSK